MQKYIFNFFVITFFMVIQGAESNTYAQQPIVLPRKPPVSLLSQAIKVIREEGQAHNTLFPRPLGERAKDESQKEQQAESDVTKQQKKLTFNVHLQAIWKEQQLSKQLAREASLEERDAWMQAFGAK